MTFNPIQGQFRKLGSKKKAAILQRFFKTGPGQYGAGDLFLGITVPVTRKFARRCSGLGLEKTLGLLKSKWHEERLLALILLIQQFNTGTPYQKRRVIEGYLKNIRYINNWDLVDLSAPHILGAYLADKDRHLLDVMAHSEALWERRIAIVATHYFIRRRQFRDTLRIAKLLISDRQDLIHKAVGWMLREVGKKDIHAEEIFLEIYGTRMPRTMLRYAIERFSTDRRKRYLKGGRRV